MTVFPRSVTCDALVVLKLWATVKIIALHYITIGCLVHICAFDEAYRMN